MKKDFSNILDICLSRIASGEDIDAVLSDYPSERDRLEPLVRVSQTISRIPKIKPAPEFLNTSKTSLLRQIYSEPASARKNRSAPGFFASVVSVLQDNLTRKRGIPVAISVLLVAVLVVTVGQFTFLKPSPAYAASCYLRILSGNVSIMEEGSDSYTAGTDGMSLETGDTVKTAADSNALLAFFDGSTIKLDPGTTLEILEMTRHEDQSPTIVLKQWVGRTWSRVEKMLDSDTSSSYQIETPSATAVVRGTLFTTEVSDNGSTSVETTQGLVSVVGEDKEVFVAPNNKTEVIKGGKPSDPETVPLPLTRIVITIAGPAAGSINDPSEASTGKFPDGEEFNQIPGSVSSISPEGNQVITISNPEPGNYNLILRYTENGTAGYHITGFSGTEVAFDFPGLLDSTNQSGSLINFSLRSAGNNLEIGTVRVKELGNNVKEKTVNQSEFNNNQGQDNSPGNSQSKGQDKSQGNTQPKGREKQQESSNLTGTGNSASEKTNQGNNQNAEQNKNNSGNNKGTSSNTAGTNDQPGKPDTGVKNENASGKNKPDSANVTSDSGSSTGQGNSKDKKENPSSDKSNNANGNNNSSNNSDNPGKGNGKETGTGSNSSGNPNNKNKSSTDNLSDDTGLNKGNSSPGNKDKRNSNNNGKNDVTDNGTSDNLTSLDFSLDLSDYKLSS